MSLRVLIVDDHPMFRDALAGVVQRLDPELQIWQASSAEDGLRLARENGEPDLVLTDLILPGMDGIAALHAFGAAFPALPVVVVTGTEDRGQILATMRAGAAGVIGKAAPAREILRALQRVLAGESHVTAALGAGDPGRAGWPPAAGPDCAPDAARDAERIGSLSMRQIEVLSLIGLGLSNKQIAAQLDLTEKTVKAHVTRVFRVLGVVNRTQAVLAAQGLGLVKKHERPA